MPCLFRLALSGKAIGYSGLGPRPVSVLAVAVFLIRYAVLLLSITAIGLALVPILVLIDLVAGGSGYGLCPSGIEHCDRPYTAGAEIMIVLVVALFAVVLTIRLLMRLARRLQNQTQP